MSDLESWLDKVYASGGDRDTLDDLYDEWALAYDQHIWASGNPYIVIQAGFVGRHVPDFDSLILDAGCGTGNMGLVLHQMGYNNLDGLDPSHGMLDIARKKEIYQELFPIALGETIDLEPETYDAVVASGVLTHGHAPPESLDGILEVTRPGGMIIFSLSKPAHDDYGFGEKMEELAQDGKWKLEGKSRLFRTYPFSEQEADLRHWVCAFQKTG